MKNRKLKNIQFNIIAAIGILLILTTFLYLGKNYFFFKKYTHPSNDFSIRYPSDWSVEENKKGVATILLSPLENDLDLFKENVNIVVQDLSIHPLNLEEYTKLAIKQMKIVFKKNMSILESKPVKLAGRPAHEFVYLGNMGDGRANIKIMHIWTLDGLTAYQVTYTALEDKYDKYLLKVKEMIRSFKINSIK